NMTRTTPFLTRLGAILGGSAGNLVEWYDWYAYSAAALYFAPVFFPKGNQTAQLLQTAAVFAVGFFARPVGAWIMGRYADRAGRKAALTLSVAMMCAGSLVIAVTPGAARIGVAAPLILLLARIFQGLSLGGEYGASATYMSEMAGRAHRGFWSSFNYVTLIGGQLVALAVLIVLQHTLSKAEMASWGWRVPFVIGAALAIVAFWLRRRMQESRSFTRVDVPVSERGSTRLLITRYPRETLTILGLTAGGSMIFYVYTTYMQKFLTNTAGFSKDQATELSAATLIAFMVAQPVAGWISDKIGRRTMLLIAFGGGALITWPVMTRLAAANSLSIAFFLILAAILVESAYTSISAVVKAELFPTTVRSLGVALPYALANAIFGGTAEYVALWFKSAGAESGFYVYASVLSAMSFLVALTMKDTRRHSRILED
ncbi:MAG: transporter, family, alpha-ketoglutarate permease, partial [Gammaproteobacteria bacterium]|nr:transporter, family, alpha-ketoglutarate permease [Gammaproteobacteria bacterium]